MQNNDRIYVAANYVNDIKNSPSLVTHRYPKRYGIVTRSGNAPLPEAVTHRYQTGNVFICADGCETAERPIRKWRVCPIKKPAGTSNLGAPCMGMNKDTVYC